MATASVESDSSKDLPASKLILHCFDRGYTCPNISPFVLKLETYLRMAEIPYEVDTKKPFGPKGKSPWIEVDGISMGDSELIIQFLNKKLGKDLWRDSNKSEKAVAQSMRIMLEDHFCCALAEWRWVDGIGTLSEIMDSSGFKMWLIKTFMSRRVRNALNTQGIGLHSREDRFHLLRQDLEAVTDYLGDKEFFLGDEPTEIDAAVFGVLAQFMWAAPGSEFNRILTEEVPTVVAYLNRMKERFWPDWDTILAKKA